MPGQTVNSVGWAIRDNPIVGRDDPDVHSKPAALVGSPHSSLHPNVFNLISSLNPTLITRFTPKNPIERKGHLRALSPV